MRMNALTRRWRGAMFAPAAAGAVVAGAVECSGACAMRRLTVIAVFVLIVTCSASIARASHPTIRQGRPHDYTVTIYRHRYGIEDAGENSYNLIWTVVHLGPFGQYFVPFTARQGLAGAILTPILIVSLVYGVFRLPTRRAYSEGADDAA